MFPLNRFLCSSLVAALLSVGAVSQTSPTTTQAPTMMAGWCPDLDKAADGLSDLADAADRPGNDPKDKEAKDLASRASDLAKAGLKNKQVSVSPRMTGSYGATGRMPKGVYRPGWETKPEKIEITTIHKKELCKIYKRLRGPNGECETEAKNAADIATMLTLAHEMIHVDQDQSVTQQPGKDPIEKDAYTKEKALAEWYKNNTMMHNKVFKFLCGWITDACNAITASC